MEKAEKLIEALAFYANDDTYKTQTVWVGGRGMFDHDPEGLQPATVMPVIEEDQGRRAREALLACGRGDKIVVKKFWKENRPEPRVRSDAEEAKLIEHMLCEVESDLAEHDRENEFIESLRDQFDNRGSLSEAQVEGLRKFYERIS